MKLNGRRRVIPFLLIVFLCRISLAQTEHANISSTSTSPSEVVYAFYNWYLHSHFPDPAKGNEKKFRQYITQRFWDEAKREWDVVVFIAAQDADPTWADHFSVSKARFKGDQAITRVALKGNHVHATLKAFLKRENGAWKIDNVKASD